MIFLPGNTTLGPWTFPAGYSPTLTIVGDPVVVTVQQLTANGWILVHTNDTNGAGSSTGFPPQADALTLQAVVSCSVSSNATVTIS